MDAPRGAETKRIGIVMIPQFGLIGFGAVIEPLRVANQLSGRQIYDWRLYSVDGEPVEASNGIALLPHGPIASEPAPNLTLVCAGFDVARYVSKPLIGWLRELARRGAGIGAISTGTVVLARAGLLDGYRCTIHWENRDAFQEEFPGIALTDAVYEIDRNRFTCSGGIASLDMMLAIIAGDHGEDLATAISEQFIHDRIRSPDDSQRNAEARLFMRRSPKLATAIKMMEENIEVPLPSAEIAADLGLSLRQLERLFKKYKGCTPKHHYLAVRLKRARQLLLHTNLSVLEISIAAGFTSQSHFTKCYRSMFGFTPTQHRLSGELGGRNDAATGRTSDIRPAAPAAE